MNLIIFSSSTGNTKLVCNEVYKRTNLFNKIIDINDIEIINLNDYENILVGYWNYIGKCDSKTENLLLNILKNKKVFLLGTLGAYDDSKHAMDMKIKVREIASKQNSVIGDFCCRGKIDLSRDLLRYHQNYTKEDEIRKLSSQDHPNENDFVNATNIVRSVFNNL